MISQVTFFVEHGETTDPLEQWIANAESEADYDGEVSVIATDFIVDVPNPTRVSVAEVAEDLKGLSWAERARIETARMGIPVTINPTDERTR